MNSQSSTPILSYKTPSSDVNSPISSPNVSSTNLEKTNRKVSRRKALHDFYHIKEQPTQPVETEESKKDSIEDVNLNDPENIKKFINNASNLELLKFRNMLSLKLSSSNQTKKSIIYDNYYELIKLSNTLGELSEIKPKSELPKSKLSGFGIYEEQPELDQNYIDDTLNELSNFIQNESVKFQGTFEDVVKKHESKE
ncbi:unnamed protein product [Candida verbasci]|uniref:Vacuolar protein sorting-associated protein 51 homolog n=1 Tax=Candida verbasci TaxID=1227364 RepID=A0A9W4TY40_9ASCO|nr:unnamed protein product [Candida verbasci]